MSAQSGPRDDTAPRPCGFTQDKLVDLMKDTHGKPTYDVYFFNVADQLGKWKTKQTAFPFPIPASDDNDRCKDCGYKISEHRASAQTDTISQQCNTVEEVQRILPKPQHVQALKHVPRIVDELTTAFNDFTPDSWRNRKIVHVIGESGSGKSQLACDLIPALANASNKKNSDFHLIYHVLAGEDVTGERKMRQTEVMTFWNRAVAPLVAPNVTNVVVIDECQVKPNLSRGLSQHYLEGTIPTLKNCVLVFVGLSITIGEETVPRTTAASDTASVVYFPVDRKLLPKGMQSFESFAEAAINGSRSRESPPYSATALKILLNWVDGNMAAVTSIADYLRNNADLARTSDIDVAQNAASTIPSFLTSRNGLLQRPISVANAKYLITLVSAPFVVLPDDTYTAVSSVGIVRCALERRPHYWNGDRNWTIATSQDSEDPVQTFAAGGDGKTCALTCNAADDDEERDGFSEDSTTPCKSSTRSPQSETSPRRNKLILGATTTHQTSAHKQQHAVKCVFSCCPPYMHYLFHCAGRSNMLSLKPTAENFEEMVSWWLHDLLNATRMMGTSTITLRQLFPHAFFLHDSVACETVDVPHDPNQHLPRAKSDLELDGIPDNATQQSRDKMSYVDNVAKTKDAVFFCQEKGFTEDGAVKSADVVKEYVKGGFCACGQKKCKCQPQNAKGGASNWRQFQRTKTIAGSKRKMFFLLISTKTVNVTEEDRAKMPRCIIIDRERLSRSIPFTRMWIRVPPGEASEKRKRDD